MARLLLKEKELDSVNSDLVKGSRKPIVIDLNRLRHRIIEEVRDLGALFGEDTVRARAKLQQYVSSVRMTPSEQDGERFYVADGEWDMLGSLPRKIQSQQTENGYIESFNGKLLDECLNVEVYFTPAEARESCISDVEITTVADHNPRWPIRRRRSLPPRAAEKRRRYNRFGKRAPFPNLPLDLLTTKGVVGAEPQAVSGELIDDRQHADPASARMPLRNEIQAANPQLHHGIVFRSRVRSTGRSTSWGGELSLASQPHRLRRSWI